MKKIILTLSLIILTLTLSACTTSITNKSATIIDTYNRTVEYKKDSERFVCLGTGALRLYSYIADINQIVGIENIEITWGSTGRPYNLLLTNINDLPIIGNGGLGASLDAEKILSANPDVIFITDYYDEETVESLQTTTNIPVIVVSYNDVAGDIFNEVLFNSLTIIGEVTGNTSRSTEVINYLESTKEDLINRTKEVTLSETIYLGGQAYKGKHGIESTSGDYKIFDLLNITNIVTKDGITSHVIVDKEQVLEWNPDIIIIDANGYQILKEDYQNNEAFYNELSAFKNNKVYLQMPFNYYSTNIEIALANAYYIGSVSYPSQFEDINIQSKYDEISTFFLGITSYEEIQESYFGGYQTINLNN